VRDQAGAGNNGQRLAKEFRKRASSITKTVVFALLSLQGDAVKVHKNVFHHLWPRAVTREFGGFRRNVQLDVARENKQLRFSNQKKSVRWNDEGDEKSFILGLALLHALSKTGVVDGKIHPRRSANKSCSNSQPACRTEWSYPSSNSDQDPLDNELRKLGLNHGHNQPTTGDNKFRTAGRHGSVFGRI